MVISTLLSELQLSGIYHITPTLSFYFSYTLETECIHAIV